ncbi:MAG: hypothetical protein H0W99_06205 [Acidobacteria bacterium]|nr:hypothetical protein [Acidobacteriota bacterium]
MDAETARRWVARATRNSPIKSAYSSALDYALMRAPRSWQASAADFKLLTYEQRATMLDLGLLPDSNVPPPAELRSWIETAHRLDTPQDLAGRRILIFAFLPYWIDYFVAISAVLLSRGCEVELAWLPYGNSFTAPDPQPFVNWVRWRYRTALGGPFPRFRSHELSPRHGEPNGSTASARPPARLSELALADTQYSLRIEDVDTENVAEHRRVFQFRMARLTSTYHLLREIIKARRPDVLLTASGAVLEFAAAWQVAHDTGILPTTVESWERRGTAVVGAGRKCIEIDSQWFWKRDEPHVLDDARRRRVEQRIEEREGTSWRDYTFQCQYANASSPAEIYERLEIDRSRAVVLACANVPWDAMFANRLGLFETMSEWLRALLKHFARRTDCQLLIRAHPGEISLGTRQTCEDIVREAMPQLPAHIKFIPPGAEFNTYSLMRIAQLGLVFNSTTGLEMAMRAVPVIMPVQAHYIGKGFTLDPQSVEEYFAMIDARLALGTEAPSLTQEQVRWAWCYFDLYAHTWPRPFPWNLPILKEDIARWPVERVVSPDGLAQFGDTFAVLAGRT